MNTYFIGQKNCVKNKSSNLELSIPPFHIFLTGGGGCGKSHLIKTIYQAVSKIFLYHGSCPDRPRVLLLAPTGVASINIDGTTLHSAFGLPCDGPFYPLNNKVLDSLRRKFSEVQLIIIDEISMVSKKVFLQIHQRLVQIFMVQELFAGKSMLVCGDLYQLPPVRAVPIFQSCEHFTTPSEYISSDL